MAWTAGRLSLRFLIATNAVIWFNAAMFPSRITCAVVLASLALITTAQAEPAFRPALVGNGPKSLVNLIDVKKLAAKGQKDAAVMFECYVGRKGKAEDGRTYRGTPGSKLLAHEVEVALERAVFVPAVADQKPAAVYFNGAVMFYMVNGQPQLHVYANQSAEDLKAGKDFIAPQLISGTHDWDAAKAELEKARLHQKNGAAVLAISVDSSGRVTNMKVASEDPPNYNFGRAALKEYAHARYIPGFRDGRPVACNFEYTSYVVAFRKERYQRLNPTIIGPQG